MLKKDFDTPLWRMIPPPPPQKKKASKCILNLTCRAFVTIVFFSIQVAGAGVTISFVPYDTVLENKQPCMPGLLVKVDTTFGEYIKVPFILIFL